MPTPPRTRPSPGAYYYLRFPDGWRLSPLRRDEVAEADGTDHLVIWEICANALAQAWAKALGWGEDALLEELLRLTYAFPRGRVVCHRNGTAEVLWGKEAIFNEHKAVEAHFGIAGNARWVFDEHERCQTDDKDYLRDILKIPEDWASVSPDELDW